MTGEKKNAVRDGSYKEKVRRPGERTAQDSACWRRLADNVVPGLPVGGDPPELRRPLAAMDAVFATVSDALLRERNTFFDTLCVLWPEKFADVAATPGRWENDALFLYVKSAANLFGVKRKLVQIKRRLSALDGAPKKLTVHLEIHALAGRTR